MMSVSSIRFWQPAPEAGTELIGAYLESSEGPLHLHEEWQFGVLDVPSKLSLGAYRRCSVGADDVTIVPPYDVHSERGVAGMSPRWRMLYVAPSIVRQLAGGRKAPRTRLSVVTDPVAARDVVVAAMSPSLRRRHCHVAANVCGGARPRIPAESSDRIRRFVGARGDSGRHALAPGALIHQGRRTSSCELSRTHASRARAATTRGGEVCNLGRVRMRFRRPVAL